MHPTIDQIFVQQRQAAFLREAEMSRLAAQATRAAQASRAARAAGDLGFVSRAIATVARIVIGEAGVATRQAPTAATSTTMPAVAIGAPARTSQAPAVGRLPARPSVMHAATSTARGVPRPSPSL